MLCALCKKKLPRRKQSSIFIAIDKPSVAMGTAYSMKHAYVHSHCKNAFVNGDDFQEFTQDFHEIKHRMKKAAGYVKELDGAKFIWSNINGGQLWHERQHEIEQSTNQQNRNL